ncbi:MAG: HigA family addiction module antitoxin [Caldilineaceae bacterium]
MAMKNPAHPGRIVKGCIEDLELSVTHAAQVLNVSRTTLSRILNGKSRISAEMAIRLAKAFGSTPAFWLRLQLNYDLAQAEKQSEAIFVERYVPPSSMQSTQPA